MLIPSRQQHVMIALCLRVLREGDGWVAELMQHGALS